MIAYALGAGKPTLIEPNPFNFFNFLCTQLNHNLLSNWFLVNSCVSNNRGFAIISPLQSVVNSSSASNIRDQNQDGTKIISLKLSDLILVDNNFLLIKTDIEGAEDYIVEALSIFVDKQAAIWLSIHPPFIQNGERVLKTFLSL